jgi:mono/diheme cytochrome c family protein
MKRMFSVTLGAATVLIMAGSAFGQDAGAEKGMRVFVAQKCTKCHSIAGRGNKKGAQDDIGSKLTAEQIRQWITDPVGMAAKTKPAPTRKPAMKKTALSPDDVDALVALLAGLKSK